MYMDVYTDFKWSADIRDILAEICPLLGLKFTMPECLITHRWLSAYDLTISTLRIIDAKTKIQAFQCCVV